MFYELRQYEIEKGKMEEWMVFMEGEIIPFQVAKGMVIAGSFRGEETRSMCGFDGSLPKPNVSGYTKRSMKATSGRITSHRSARKSLPARMSRELFRARCQCFNR